VKARKVIKIAKKLLSLETPIGDEENGHLSDFIEGQGPWRIGSAFRMRRAARLVL
jgi:DNA-directed RNA polymerase sigma subunit (sigma70/sigma32)